MRVAAQVNLVDVERTAYVRFVVTATNGSYAQYEDKTVPDAEGWYTWDWPGAGAGDGEYSFTAVAVSTNDRLGEPWKLTYMLDKGPPGRPILAESDVRAGDKVVAVRWTPSDPPAGDLAHYVVVRTHDVVDDLGVITTVTDTFTSLNKNSTTYIDRSASNGTAYTYAVYAVDERMRTSDSSNAVTCTPAIPTDVTFPSMPTGLTAALLGQTVTLHWAANSSPEAVVEYRVYRDEDVSFTSPIAVVPSSSGLTSYSYVDPQIGWNQTHTYYVTAVDAALNESPKATSPTIRTPTACPGAGVRAYGEGDRTGRHGHGRLARERLRVQARREHGGG